MEQAGFLAGGTAGAGWGGCRVWAPGPAGACLSSFGDPAQVLYGPTSRKMLKHWDEQEENQPRASGMPSLHFCCAKKKSRIVMKTCS